MASPDQVANLKSQLAAFDTVDYDKLSRPGLGVASLKAELEPRLQKINRLKNLTLQYGHAVHDQTVNQLAQMLSQLAHMMAQQAGRSNQDYIAQSQSFLSTIDASIEAAKQFEPPFITAAVEARGFLEDEGIRQEYQRAVVDLRNESQAALNEVKTEARHAIEEAGKLAKVIEEQARRTATKISVAEAQQQFREAQTDLNRKVKTWGWLSGLSILGFFLTAILLFYPRFPADIPTWHAIYYSVLRIVILSAIGGLAGFCLRIFRAYMNMRERNLHRQRIANSVEAFVVSAQTPEVRDFILANLVEAVVAFGVSGLLTRETDTLGTQRVPVDTITRLIGVLGARKEGS